MDKYHWNKIVKLICSALINYFDVTVNVQSIRKVYFMNDIIILKIEQILSEELKRK